MKGTTKNHRFGLSAAVQFASLIILLAGCAFSPFNSLEQRRAQASKLATDVGWQRFTLDAGVFALAAFIPANLIHADTLTIYIEGDGRAWINSTWASFDPTPRDPLALRLALRDPSGNAVYLARPCQFVINENRRNCEAKYWTSHRFAPEVIESGNQAVNILKARYGADKIMLVGYSGGGAVAALIAARRDDVALLVTVAGNLDHVFWTASHGISPLSGSLNPADAAKNLQQVPQRHYVGARDVIIDERVARAYAARFETNNAPSIIVIPEFDHHCCWIDIWPDLVQSGFKAR